jgi:hypothetical protein
MKINAQWLAEFVAGFEQQIEGEDGAAVGRQLWINMDYAWREARAAQPALGYEDAVAEAEAWNEAADDNGACPVCGEDGGTSCGMPDCQY